MRRFDRVPPEAEFPSRYTLDEARFTGGHEHTRNQEVTADEPTTHGPR